MPSGVWVVGVGVSLLLHKRTNLPDHYRIGKLGRSSSALEDGPDNFAKEGLHERGQGLH
jgi:hypothetical protein